jgi:hypothetical protein
MAIKLSSKNQDDIPTLTEVVTEEADNPSLSKQSAQNGGNLKQNRAGPALSPKFERVLEKIIYKKLHLQLATTSQVLAAEIMAELQKYLQSAGNTQNKADKNQD